MRRWRVKALIITAAVALAVGVGVAPQAAQANPRPSAEHSVTADLADSSGVPVGGIHLVPLPRQSDQPASITFYLMQMGDDKSFCLADPSAGPSGTKLVGWGCQTQNYWFGWSQQPTPYNGGDFPPGTYVELEMRGSDGNLSGLCIDDHGGGYIALQVYTCNGTNSQAFAMGNYNSPPPGNEWWNGYADLNVQTSACISDAHDTHTNGNPIVGWPCDALNSQIWLGP